MKQDMSSNADASITTLRVFISYSHDSTRHKARVLELSNRLREEGVDCQIDAYHEAPPEGWPRWMLNQLENARYVLVVCTETYERRFRGKEQPGKGKGAKWEGAVITQHLYDVELHNTRFIPVLLDASDESYLPIVLRGTTFYDVSSEDGYLKLYRRLTAQPEIDVPPVAASIRELSAKDVISEQRSAEAKEKLNQAQVESDRNNFEAATELIGEAVNLARQAGDSKIERRAVLGLTRSLGNLAISHDVEGSKRDELVADIHKNIDRLTELGEKPAVVSLEKALAARLSSKPEEALIAAQEAMDSSEDDFSIQADALIAKLQALWQLNRATEGLALSAEVERVRSHAEDDPSLCLDASWLRTLCKAEKIDRADVIRFTENVRSIPSRGSVSRDRIAMIINEVEHEFGRANRTEDRLLLCELAYEIMEPLRDPRRLVLVLMEAAELSAVLGDGERARLYLGQADSWASQKSRSADKQDEDSENSLEAMRLFARGRTLTRLADGADLAYDLYQEAYVALIEAKDFASQHRANIRGDIEVYMADLNWWLGRTAVNMGRLEEGAKVLRAVRSDAAMTNQRFASEVGVKAWGLEAEALALSGLLPEATKTVDALLSDSRLPEAAKNRPRHFRRFLANVVQPTVDWFKSPDALKIQRAAREHGLRAAVSNQFTPLISLWKEWEKEPGGAAPYSEFLDFWGRGGFSRVAAAIRARPHAAIAVDAQTIEDIRKWVRILCPLFDTVIVKWKGELGSGMVIIPFHMAYGDGEDDFGGHGYSVTAGSVLRDRPDWCPALSWANPIPQEVTRFLASEALPLIKTGRLVVLPAPLVGCTQTAIGWTDTLLVDSFLGGVVNVARREESAASTIGRQKILDITRVQIPFIDNVSLVDLANVLDETEPWVGPLRSLLLRTMSNEDLNYERWDRIAALEYDIQQACKELREHLQSVATRFGQQQWTVVEATGGISAGERGDTPLAQESITGLLQSVSSSRRELAPWIPYLRLQDYGGHLHWTCPLDNTSNPPDQLTIARLGKGPEMHTWLYPGTPGWNIPTAVRFPAE